MTEPTERDSGEDALFDDKNIDLSDVHWTDSLVVFVFWVLALVVFLQFFTRYIMNDSLGWTEEIARFLLIAVTFIGAVIAVRRRSHIAVEFLYRWMPRPLRRVLQLVVDLVSLAFYGALTWFTVQLAQRTRQMMVSIDVPKSLVYWGVAACFAAMTVLALFVAWRHLATGTSDLIDPDRRVEASHPAD